MMVELVPPWATATMRSTVPSPTAEVGSMSSKVGQIQGVWVDPQRRGEGLGAAGTAAVAQAIAAGGRTASLYVNCFNTPARAAYRRIGFVEVGTFATVLID